MACIPKYVQELDLSDEDKIKLATVHTKIWTDARLSKVFKYEDGKLYSYKPTERYAMATAYVAKVRAEYGKPVVSMVKEGPTKHKLAINVESLQPTKQPTLPLEPETVVESESAQEKLDLSKELLISGQSTKETVDLYEKMLSLPDDEVNNKIKACE